MCVLFRAGTVSFGFEGAGIVGAKNWTWYFPAGGASGRCLTNSDWFKTTISPRRFPVSRLRRMEGCVFIFGRPIRVT